MTRVYLSFGSNIDREHNIRSGLDALAQHFPGLVLSPVYESAAVGFDGEPFLNLVVAIDTDLAVGELSSLLRAISKPITAAPVARKNLPAGHWI
jgi:2-amino-4-hydroxy-6-hydroxymethyldihydropteridine diphosphokinase